MSLDGNSNCRSSQAILGKMVDMAQQYTRYMSKAYPTEKEETIGKEILGKLQTKSVRDFMQEQNFKAREIPRTPQYTTISYMKSKKDADKLKRCLGNKYMSNKALGEKTFEYYKGMECPDEE